VDATKLVAIVSLILALSIASERLVEIVKGTIPFLSAENADPRKEGIRRSLLQALAVVAGVVTSFLARDYVPYELSEPAGTWAILGLGLLASGGSGFWNSILTYVSQVKDLKELETAAMKKKAAG
jgi:hypothetical protein